MTSAPEHRYSIDELNARLEPRARDVCVAIFGRVQERSGNIWMLSPNQAKPNWTSFSYNPQKQVWSDFGADNCSGRGLMSFIATFACSGDYKRAFQWAKDFLGLTGRAPDPVEAQKFKAAQEKRDAENKAQAEANARKAKGLWLNAAALDGADPASLYLANRALPVGALPGGIPRALRFAQTVYASDPEVAHRGPWPCMVAAIARHGDGIIASHRTYLRATDQGWIKRTWPACKTGKQVKGAYAGGYIALTRGASGKSLREAQDGEWVQIGEGIEDALSGAILRPEYRALAAVSLSNLGSLVLPPAIKGAFILMQNDSDPVTVKQFDQAMDRLWDRGIEPAIVKFDKRCKDLNDVLRGKVKEVDA